MTKTVVEDIRVPAVINVARLVPTGALVPTGTKFRWLSPKSTLLSVREE